VIFKIGNFSIIGYSWNLNCNAQNTGIKQSSTLVYMLYLYMLQLKDLRVGQWEEPCIGLTQENSIESSVQDGLPYIQIPNGLCGLFLTYPKRPYVCLKVNICFTHYMMSSFQNLLHPSMRHVTCDHVI